MNHLVIFCHPNPASFNGSIADAVEAVSAAMGHDTHAAEDLYAIGFNPVLGKVEMDAPPHMRAQDVRQEQEFHLPGRPADLCLSRLVDRNARNTQGLS